MSSEHVLKRLSETGLRSEPEKVIVAQRDRTLVQKEGVNNEKR